jgi:hypothetical protein
LSFTFNLEVPDELRVLLCALLLGLPGLPASAMSRPETRVGGSPVFSPNFTFADDAQPVAASGETLGYCYDLASGMHKYLYCQNDSVNMFDLNGHDGDLCSINFTMGIMAQQMSLEMKGAQGALEGARAMFGADQTVNNIIYGLDVANIINDKVGQVALVAGGICGSLKLFSWFSELGITKQVVDFAYQSMDNLQVAGVFTKYGKTADKRCAFWAASFAHAFEGSIMTPRMIENLSDGSLTSMEAHFKGTFSPGEITSWTDAKAAITEALTAKGPGSQAIVVGDNVKNSAVGHAFNVINKNGKNTVVDISAAGSTEGEIASYLTNFKFMVINY